MVDALEYPPIWMGKANCVVKTGSVPSLPGKTKSNSDHSSVSLFWIGEPLMMTLCTV